ncbi:vitamin K epoxide reductase family protein [Patescibacteria group bacterium]|nr:MAG: vitamin K epoxide reductase family protein [Patescibacteria group bacterium]
MTNLKISLMAPFPKIPKWIITAFFITALIGFIDASFLTIEHYRGVVPPCSIISGCEKVTTSDYSKVFGIPLALFGAVYYFALLVLIIAYFDLKNAIILKIAALITPIGLLASIYFVYLQLIVLKAICLYCMISAAASIILVVLGMIILRAAKRDA